MNKKLLLFFLLCFSAVVKAQTNGASIPAQFSDGYTILHSTAKVYILVRNEGSAVINNISYIVEDFNSGSTTSEKLITVDNGIAVDGSAVLMFRVAAGSTTGATQKSVTITKVNGVKNEISANNSSSFGYINTYSERLPRMTVEEEYTGTWCGWCPRGTVGMENLSEKYPEEFIGIAYHYDDPMYIPENGTHEGFPACKINRTLDTDTYFGTSGNVPLGIEKDFLLEQEKVPAASVNLTAEWENSDRNKINIKTDGKFVVDSKYNYALAYILVADSLKGEGGRWRQTNYYSGKADYANDPYMEFFYNAGSSVENMYYNHVAVASVGTAKGIEGSVPMEVVDGGTYSHTYTMDISNKSIIQDKDKLKLVALLLTKDGKQVVNAKKVKVTYKNTDGIKDTHDNANVYEVERYTIDGVKLSKPTKGINIIKLSNGKTIKQLIK